MKTWFAVYTQPRNESLAVANLQRQGFETYFPRFMKRVSHARRVSMVPAALFPRYLFVAVEFATGGWRAIRSTRGVIDLVRNGSDPVSVPDAVIDGMRAREDASGMVVLARQVTLMHGDPIRIDAGPFVNHEAIFQSQRDQDRVVALLALLGRQVFVEVPIQAVVPLRH